MYNIPVPRGRRRTVRHPRPVAKIRGYSQGRSRSGEQKPPPPRVHERTEPRRAGPYCSVQGRSYAFRESTHYRQQQCLTARMSLNVDRYQEHRKRNCSRRQETTLERLFSQKLVISRMNGICRRRKRSYSYFNFTEGQAENSIPNNEHHKLIVNNALLYFRPESIRVGGRCSFPSSSLPNSNQSYSTRSKLNPNPACFCHMFLPRRSHVADMVMLDKWVGVFLQTSAEAVVILHVVRATPKRSGFWTI